MADWQQSWHGFVFDVYLNVSNSFREDRPMFMIMSYHTNAMQKGNVITNQDLNFVYNYSKGFPSPSQSATGGGESLMLHERFTFYP